MLSNKKGAILGIALIFTFVLTLIGYGLLQLSGTNKIEVVKSHQSNQVFWITEAAVEHAVSAVKVLCQGMSGYPTNDELGAISQPVFSGYTFDEFTIVRDPDNPNPFQDVITKGPYKGLQGTILPIKISVSVSHDNLSAVEAKIIQFVEHQTFSTFQFGIFYENDLEILPGPAMAFAGPVHSNEDIYVAAENSGGLSFDSYVTSAGDILHDRKNDPGGASSGYVRFRDGEGVYQQMYQGGRWLDSTEADWITESQVRWDGNVQSQDHGITPLSLPLSSADEYHDIIERANAGDSTELAAAKYHNKADLIIIDGVGTDGGGTPVDLSSVVTTTTFHDKREGADITVREVDIAALEASGNAPSNGIIYVSESGSNKGVRLVNGADLPAGGLTIASDNPLYIKGDYNSVDRQSSSVASDAVYFLSNSWDDDDSDRSMSYRIASSTTINTAVMTGNTETTVGNYNGGLENIFRLLENWNSKTLTYKGSIVVLWYSEQAQTGWGGSDIYRPPTRNWSYDDDFSLPANQPAGAASLYSIQRGSWIRVK